MTDIFSSLVQTIEESAFPHYSKWGEYNREQRCAERHMQWLEEHLDNEAQMHLEKLRRAEFHIGTLEREALIRTAIAAGIRFGLPG